MKLILTADIHNGYPGKQDDSIWSMDIIRQYANEHKITNIIVAGDLFHNRVSLEIPVLNKVYDILLKAKADGQSWFSFPGNHDMALKNSWEFNSLHSFKDVLTIKETVSSFTFGGRKFWIIPFIHYEEKYMEVVKAVNTRASKDDILLTHIGVTGAKLNECFLLKNWNIVNFKDTKFSRIYTGHFHCYQQVGDNVWYTGSPIPFRFDEGVVDHGFLVYDTETNKHEFVKIFDICEKYSPYKAADYLTIIDTDIEQLLPKMDKNNIRILLTRDYTNNELITLKASLIKNGAINVSWLMQKKKIDEAQTMHYDIKKLSVRELFNKFVTDDAPELDINLLNQLHEQIEVEADNILVTEEEDA